MRGKTRRLSNVTVIKKLGNILNTFYKINIFSRVQLTNSLQKKCSLENIVAFINEKPPQVKVSFCPNEMGQNETDIIY